MNSFINFDVHIYLHNSLHPPQAFILMDKLLKKKVTNLVTVEDSPVTVTCWPEGHILNINSVSQLSCLSENIPKLE